MALPSLFSGHRALSANLRPRQLSFAGGVQTVQAFRWWLLTRADGSPALTQVATIVLQAVATHRVGDRPDRVEPRQKKRRPKNDGYLDKPRQQARQERLRS